MNNLRHLQSLVSLISMTTFVLTGATTDVEALDIYKHSGTPWIGISWL